MTKPTSGCAQTATDTTGGQATVTILLDGKSESVPLRSRRNAAGQWAARRPDPAVLVRGR